MNSLANWFGLPLSFDFALSLLRFQNLEDQHFASPRENPFIVPHYMSPTGSTSSRTPCNARRKTTPTRSFAI